MQQFFTLVLYSFKVICMYLQIFVLHQLLKMKWWCVNLETTSGDTCNLLCNKGFILAVSESRYCMNSAKWSGSATSCVKYVQPVKLFGNVEAWINAYFGPSSKA